MNDRRWELCMQGLAELTPREWMVLERIALGEANEAICRALWVSPKTVETHVARIYAKLALPPDRDVHRRVVAAVVYARHAELVGRPGPAVTLAVA